MVNYKAQIIDIDYFMDRDNPVIRLFCKAKNDKQIIAMVRDFRPYFYVIPKLGTEKELENKLKDLKFTDSGREIGVTDVKRERRRKDKEKIEVFKIFAQNPSDIPKIKNEVKKWEEVKGKREFDIPFYKRYLIDNDLTPFSWIQLKGKKLEKEWEADSCIQVESITEVKGEEEVNLNKMAFDIETYNGEVIMLSLYSENFKRVYTSEEFESKPEFLRVLGSEKEIIEKFVEVIKEENVDMILGYNTDDFDFEVLRERAENHNIELELGREGSRMTFARRGRTSSAKIKGRVHIDLYRFVETILSRSLKSETLTLENVANEILGEGKVDMKWRDIKKAWRDKNELGKLSRYSLKDSKITYELGENLLPQIFSLSRLVGQLPFDVSRLTYGQLVENYLTRKAFERRILVPNRPKRSDIRKRRSETPFKGGFVYEPEEGLHEDIALFDFRSLYPSIALSYNISPDSLNVEDCNEGIEVEVGDNKYEFCQDRKAFIPEVLDKLVKERYELKSKMKKLEKEDELYKDVYARQYALKILANSFYGYTGYAGAKWYCRPCAESITALGRKHIHDTIEKAEELGFEVIYGDTDSVLLKKDNIEDEALKFQEKVNSELPEYMELELEDLYERGLFTYTKKGKGAKKKYALLSKEGNIKITGFEKVRRDWSELAKETQEEVIKKVLHDKVEEADKEVIRTVEKLKKGEVPLDKLVIYTRLKKSPEEYKTTSPHVEAAKRAIQRGIDIEPGNTINYIVTKGKGAISDKAEIKKFADNYDPKYYIEHQIIPAAMRILKVMGYEKEDFLMKGRQSGLGKFG